MRTTLQIDDDLYQAARSIAQAEDKTIGEVISAMIRKALSAKDYIHDSDDLPVFRVSESIAPLTTEMVRKAEEDSTE